MVLRRPSHRDCLVQDVSALHRDAERIATCAVENGMARVQIVPNTYLTPIGDVEPIDAVAQLLISMITVCVAENAGADGKLLLEPHTKMSG
jgi:hypothetical protein